MSTKYADRAFLSMNGVPISDIQSASLKQNHNRRAVPSMTSDGFNQGFVQGNRDIDISFSLAVRNKLGRPKIENLDFEASNIQITFAVGADLYVATGVFLKDNSDDASGIGQEVKGSFNCGALKLTDTAGNSVLFDIQL